MYVSMSVHALGCVCVRALYVYVCIYVCMNACVYVCM